MIQYPACKYLARGKFESRTCGHQGVRNVRFSENFAHVPGFELSGSRSRIATHFSFSLLNQALVCLKSRSTLKRQFFNFDLKHRFVFLLFYNALYGEVSLDLLNVLNITLNTMYCNLQTSLFVAMFRTMSWTVSL